MSIQKILKDGVINIVCIGILVVFSAWGWLMVDKWEKQGAILEGKIKEYAVKKKELEGENARYKEMVKEKERVIEDLNLQFQAKEVELIKLRKDYLTVQEKLKNLSKGEITNKTQAILNVPDVYERQEGLLLGWQGARKNLSLLFERDELLKKNQIMEQEIILLNQKAQEYQRMNEYLKLQNKNIESALKECERLHVDFTKQITFERRRATYNFYYGVLVGVGSGYILSKVIK